MEIRCLARGSSRAEVGAVPGAALPKPDQTALPKWRIVMLGALLGKKKALRNFRDFSEFAECEFAL